MEFFDVTIMLSENFLGKVNCWKPTHFPLKNHSWTSIGSGEEVGSMMLKSSTESHPLHLDLPIIPPSKRSSNFSFDPIEHKKKRASSNRPNLHNLTPVSRPGNSFSGTAKPSLDTSDMFAECILAGEKIFVCGVCNYKTKIRPNMRKHVECMHSDNPPCFRCSTCGSSFKEKSKLKGHYMKTHNLEEPVAKAAAAIAVSNR